jgi:hypothetical protein
MISEMIPGSVLSRLRDREQPCRLAGGSRFDLEDEMEMIEYLFLGSFQKQANPKE